MIFMVLVGGLGTFEGPILGAVIFFLIEYLFGETGVWYLVGLGAAAIVFALFLPRGLWGTIEEKFGIRLLPVGSGCAYSTPRWKPKNKASERGTKRARLLSTTPAALLAWRVMEMPHSPSS